MLQPNYQAATIVPQPDSYSNPQSILGSYRAYVLYVVSKFIEGPLSMFFYLWQGGVACSILVLLEILSPVDPQYVNSETSLITHDITSKQLNSKQIREVEPK